MLTALAGHAEVAPRAAEIDSAVCCASQLDSLMPVDADKVLSSAAVLLPSGPKENGVSDGKSNSLPLLAALAAMREEESQFSDTASGTASSNVHSFADIFADVYAIIDQKSSKSTTATGA